MMRPPLTTSMTGPETTSSFSFFCSIVPHAALVLRALLRKDQAAVLVLLLEYQGFELFAELHDLVRIDVVADRELFARDHALGLVADVEQHLIGVDLHDLAVHEVAVVERDDRLVDRVFERHSIQVVDGDHRLGFLGVRSPVLGLGDRFGGGGLGARSSRLRGRVRVLIQHSYACFARDDMRLSRSFSRAHVAAPVERPVKGTGLARNAKPSYSQRCASNRRSGTSIDGGSRR